MTINATAKVAAVAAGLAMASSMLSFATFAHAADACSVGTVNLTVGSTGDAVKCLQETLIAGKYLVMPAGVTTGTFGPLTKSAVMKWQAEKGISPAAGYFGPISRAAFTGVAGGTTGGSCATPFDPITGKPCGTTPTTPSNLSGTDGTISDYTLIGSLNNEEVAEGKTDVKVYGADVEASKDGDIALKSIKVVFDGSSNVGDASKRLNRYIDSVDVMLGSTKIGSASADDFTKGSEGVYSKTIALSGNTTIKADATGKLYLAVNAQDTIDSADASTDANWNVAVDSVRYVDGSGVYTTDSGDTVDTSSVDIDFVDYATASDTEFKVATASDSPKKGIVMVDDNSSTDNVVLLKGKITLKGDSDVLVDELPVNFDTADSGWDLDEILSSVTLKIDGEEYTESTIPGSAEDDILFNNLDLTVGAGDSIDFEVLADINSVEDFGEGAMIRARMTNDNLVGADMENDQGDQVPDGDRTGSATGEYQELRTEGIGLTFVSASTDVAAGNSPSDDLGTFVIKFKVTAFGNTVYVSSLADSKLSGVTTGKTSVVVDRSGTATVGGTSVTLANITDNDMNAAGLYEIEEGTSETFEVTTTVQLPAAGDAGQYRASLGGVSWSTSSTDATPDNAYTSNLTSFKTSYRGLN